MKATLSIALCFISLTSIGQINITSADMPDAGDTLRYSIAASNTTFLNTYQNTGANHTWNFSYLQPMAQGIEEYKTSSQTSYNFPNTTAKLFADSLSLGGVTFTDIYEFRKMDSSKIEMVGRGISYNGLGFPLPVSVPYTDTGVVYQFPMSYMDRDSNYFVAEYSNIFIGVFYQAYGYRINHVDGYGQVSTPYGNFNCIRVVTDILESDTISYDTINFKLNTHLREYKWLAKGIEYPVMKVTGTVVAGNFIPSLITYRDSVRNLIVGVEEHLLSNVSPIYPNPNPGDKFQLKMEKSQNKKFELDLLDVSGRLIRSYQSSPLKQQNEILTFDLPSELHNGIYFLSITDGEKRRMEKLIINKY